MKTCIECRNWFDPRGDTWKTYCTRCYATKKRAEERADDEADMRAWRAGYAIGRRDALALTARLSLDTELVRRTIRLTHPDRHPTERFTEANTVTASLLNLLEEAA